MLACLAPLDKYYEDDQHSLLMKNAAQVAWVYHSKLLHLFRTCICLKFYAWLYLVLLGFCKLHWPQHLMWSHCEDNLSTLQYAAQVCLGIAWSRCASKTAQNTCEMTTLEYDQTKKRTRRDVFVSAHRTRPSTMTEPGVHRRVGVNNFLLPLKHVIFEVCIKPCSPKNPYGFGWWGCDDQKRASHQRGS